MHFFGEFSYKLDEKGRIPVPPRFRALLKDGMILSPGPEKFIAAYSIREWQRLSEQIDNSVASPSKLRKLKRSVFGQAFTAGMDGQGRISLPEKQREYAGIVTGAVVVGVSNHLEIWSEEAWEAEKNDDLAQAWEIIETLESR